MGFLRLLTNPSIMKEQVLNTSDAWAAFDTWLDDPRVEFYPEPRSMDTAFRQATTVFSRQPASKWIGDCYLLAFARESDTTLVTFDNALHRLAASSGYPCVMPS
jgi:predicted nucleic acid-binding protein